MPRNVLREDELDAPVSEIAKRSLRSGISGMSAMVVQVCSLMWMRTIMNYQYRHGGQIKETVQKLYKEGGVRRFYRGLPVALIQGPVSRFGDTFSNTLFLAFMNRSKQTRDLPTAVKTLGASLTAATFRIFLIPIDATKTIMQVEGKQGLSILKAKVKAGGPRVLYHGALASASATFMGHYPWFTTFNILNGYLPKYESGVKKFARNGRIGFCASVISDSVSNSLRVIKTTKQTYQRPTTYPEVVKEIVNKDGVLGLMGRGLKVRIMTNGMQGLLFSILWNTFDEMFAKRGK